MSLSLDPLLCYWRASLQDSIQHSDAEALDLYDFSLDLAARGELPIELCDQLWADAGTTIPLGTLSRMTSIPVMIAPVLLFAGYNHGQTYVDLKKAQAPVWLTCQCDRNGKIRPQRTLHTNGPMS